MEKSVARIFQEMTGRYHYCDIEVGLDARGQSYRTIIAAVRAASYAGYSHVVRGKKVRKITPMEHKTNWATG